MDVDAVSLFLALLTVGAEVAVAAAVVLVVAARLSPAADRLLGQVREAIRGNGPGLALVVAAVATAGSLYFSESANFIPCKLCWYQRIAMYPLVPLLAVGIATRDDTVRRYGLALAVPGALIATYHVLLERFPSLESGTCDPTAPCTLRWVEELGYITIPVMSLSAFLLVIAVLLLDPGRSSS